MRDRIIPKGLNRLGKNTKIDYEKYKRYETWYCIEAIFLLAGVHPPEVLNASYITKATNDDLNFFDYLVRSECGSDILDAISRRADGLRLKDKVKPREFVTLAHGLGFSIPDELKDLIDVPKPEEGEKQSAKDRDAQCIALANRIHEENPILSKGNIARIVLKTPLGGHYTCENAIKKALKGKIPGLNSGNPTNEVSDQQKKLETEIIALKRYSQ